MLCPYVLSPRFKGQRMRTLTRYAEDRKRHLRQQGAVQEIGSRPYARAKNQCVTVTHFTLKKRGLIVSKCRKCVTVTHLCAAL